MSTYRASWFCPATKVPKVRDFTSRAKAKAFAKLPRDFFVYVARAPVGRNDGGRRHKKLARAQVARPPLDEALVRTLILNGWRAKP